MITKDTYLCRKTTSGGTTTTSKLINITDYSDLFGAPERQDNTTLSDSARTYEPGIEETPELVFGFNYNKTDYDTLKALEGTDLVLQLRFGKDGALGAWTWTSRIHVGIKGGGVNGVVKGTITCYNKTQLVPETDNMAAIDLEN